MPVDQADAVRRWRDARASGFASTAEKSSGPAPDRPASRELYYDTIAESFDGVMNEYDVLRRIEVVFDEFLGAVDLRGRSLLDAGCGTGRFSAVAAARGATVTSLDIGPRLLEVARRRCRTTPVCGDVGQLAFADAAFDVVVSSECIEHTVDPRRAVAELLRVCRPGGLVAITCPNRAWRWSCAVAGALRLRAYDGIENWPGRHQLRGWVTAHGGQIVDARGIHLFPFVVPALNGLLRRLDRFGRRFGAVYVNQAVLALRLESAGQPKV